MVVIKHGKHDQLVVDTADHLADTKGGELVFARFMKIDSNEAQIAEEKKYLEMLSEKTVAKASVAMFLCENEVKKIIKNSYEYDLIVLGAPHRSRFGRFFGTEMDKILENANCSVVTLQANFAAPLSEVKEKGSIRSRIEP